MNTRKMTLITTTLAIALLFVGVGYAYTAYTSSNVDNNATISYIELTQTEYTFAKNDIKFDTYNQDNATTFYYKVAENPVNLVIPGTTSDLNKTYQCGKLGSIEFNVAMKGITTPPDYVKVTVHSSVNFDTSENWTYFIADDNGNVYSYRNPTSETETWNEVSPILMNYSSTDNKIENVTVNVYYGFLTTGKTPKELGADKFYEATMPDPLEDGIINFKAETVNQTPTNP